MAGPADRTIGVNEGKAGMVAGLMIIIPMIHYDSTRCVPPGNHGV